MILPDNDAPEQVINHFAQNPMGNRLAYLLAVALISVSGALFAQSATSLYSGTGQGSNCSGASSANDPSCQQYPQGSTGRDNNPSGYGPVTSPMPSMQQLDGVYVDSAGQQRQNYPGQNYPGQNYPGWNYPGNMYPGKQQQQVRDPITDFQRLVSNSTGQLIPIYGRQLFQDVPSTFAPVDQTPVTPDYVIGPGDELLIRVWGQVVFNDRLTVDRSGSIYVPKVGSIHVAGIPFSDLEKHIRSEIGRVFRNFNLNVNMGQLRSIQVFVLGQAQRPGSYTVSSLSTLVNALFSSGGPSVQGSMRSIQLKRDGKTVSNFDLYDLLNKGDKSQDSRLLPGDVIFIPPAGSQVAVTGGVRTPAIYELKGETTLQDVIHLAGGLSPTASDAHISLERIQQHSVREATQVNLDADGKATMLHDGDVLRIFSIAPQFDKSVTLRGNLANPGRFAWHPGMRLSELIPERGALLTNNYWQNHNQLGLPGRMFFEPLPSTAAAPSATRSDAPQTDSLTEPRYTEQQTTSPAPVTADAAGQRTPLAAEQETSRGSIASQQSRIVTGNSEARTSRVEIHVPAPEIDWAYAVIERLDPASLKNTLLPFNLGALVLNHDVSQDLELQGRDVVTIFSQADIRVPLAQQTKFVRLEGEIASSGLYSARPGETLRQLIERAGGLAPDAYLFGSDFTRESARVLQQQRLDEYVNSLAIDLQRQGANKISSAVSPQDVAAASGVLSGQKEMIAALRQIRATGRIVIKIKPDASSVATIPDITLEDGDAFVVPSLPSNVNVVGAVYDQNAFLYSTAQRVQDYLHLAGGPNRDADRKHAFVIRADGSVFSRETAGTLWGNTFEHARVNPGDTIVMPEKLFKASLLRGFLEWSQIFSQLVLGAAAVRVITP